MLRTCLLLSIIGAVAFAGLVKRDAVDDIGDSINNLLGNNDNPLDDLKEGQMCMLNSQCMEPIQFCNTSALPPQCQYVIWVWVGLGVVAALLLLTIFGSCLCCSCCCLHGLCRKK